MSSSFEKIRKFPRDTFFTSDLLLGDYSLINTKDKPGIREFDTVTDMDNAIIYGINSTVFPGDALFILGGFCADPSPGTIASYLDRLRCKNIYLIRGQLEYDHYKQSTFINSKQGLVGTKFITDLFEFVGDYYEIEVMGQRIILSRYPSRFWNGMEEGSWQLHGFTKGKADDYTYSHMYPVGTASCDIACTQLDVSVDNMYKITDERTRSYVPFSFSDLDLLMDGRQNIILNGECN